MIVLLCWLGLAVILMVLGKLCDSKVLIGISAVMLLMTCMIGDATY